MAKKSKNKNSQQDAQMSKQSGVLTDYTSTPTQKKSGQAQNCDSAKNCR